MESIPTRPSAGPPEAQRIRVVHIITKLELGGAQLNTLYTVDNLDRSSFDPHLLSGGGGILTRRIQGQPHFTIIGNLIRPIRPWHDFRAFFQIRNELKKIQPQVVHTHSSKAGIIGRTAAFSLKTPVIVHSVHGFSFSRFHGFWKRLFFKTAEKIASRFTDHFVFVSREDLETAKTMKWVNSNYSLIRSGFPLEDFLTPRRFNTSLRKKFKIKTGDFVCGTMAPFKPQKGLHQLVETASLVLKKNRDVIFFVAGDGALRGQIEREIKRRQIDHHFRLPGFIENIAPVLDMFDCGLSTALWEGLPQSIVQMRLKKIPVVVSNIPGHREIIQDGQNGFLVKTGNTAEFARKVLYLKHNPKKRQLLGKFKDDFSRWDADHMVKQQQELYIEQVKSKLKNR